MARQSKNFSTTNPDIQVHMTWTIRPNGTGPVTLRAYPIDAHTGTRIDGSPIRRQTAKTPAAIPVTQQYLLSRVQQDISRLARNNSKATSQFTATHASLAAAFETLKNSGEAISVTWGSRYQDVQLTYFERNILPFLASHEGEWLDTSRDALRQHLISGVLQAKRSSGLSSTAESTVDKSLSAAQVIYDRLHEIDPSLPEISLRPAFTGRRIQREQLKSIPPDVRRKLIAALEQLIDTNTRIAAAAIVMFCCGLRTSEAAAIHPEALIPMDTATSLLVCWQVVKSQRIPLLKTFDSYRIVPIPAWGLAMLRHCFDLIPPLDEQTPLCNPHDLSATLKAILLQCGITNTHIASAELAMQHRPDTDSTGVPIQDVVAYILRRDWSSRARNLCGLTSTEIDFLLGHKVKIPKAAREDLRHPNVQKMLSQKLERYVYSSTISLHPKHTPYELFHGSDFSPASYDVVRFKNADTEPLCVQLDLEAVLPCDPIAITMPADCNAPYTVRLIPTHCIRIDEPVIGSSIQKEVFDNVEDT